MRTPAFGESRRNSTSGVLPMHWTMSAYLPPQGRLSRPGVATSESVVPEARARRTRRRSATAGHRRQDHDGVGRSDRRVEAVEHAHVLVVEGDVDGAVQLAVLREELALRLRVLARERAQDLADARAVGLDLLRAADGAAQDRWDLDRAHAGREATRPPSRRLRSPGRRPSPRRRS